MRYKKLEEILFRAKRDIFNFFREGSFYLNYIFLWGYGLWQKV